MRRSRFAHQMDRQRKTKPAQTPLLVWRDASQTESGSSLLRLRGSRAGYSIASDLEPAGDRTYDTAIWSSNPRGLLFRVGSFADIRAAFLTATAILRPGQARWLAAITTDRTVPSNLRALPMAGIRRPPKAKRRITDCLEAEDCQRRAGPGNLAPDNRNDDL